MGRIVQSKPTAWVYIAAFVIVVIWGCTFVQTKVLINSGLRPDEIFVLRFVIAYLLILPFSWRRLFMNSFKDEMIAVSLGLTGGSLYFLTENYALAYGYCSNVSLIVCLTPLVTAIIVGWLYPSERLGKAGVVGSLVALVGMSLVVFNGNFVLKLSPLGDILALGACLCWALYSLLIKRLSANYSNMFITRKVFGYGILTILPLFISRPPRLDLLLDGGPVVWCNVLTLGCVASMLCYTLWNYVLKRLGTVRATNFIYFNPVVTMVCSWMVLDERITWMALLGAALVLLGMFVAEKNKS